MMKELEKRMAESNGSVNMSIRNGNSAIIKKDNCIVKFMILTETSDYVVFTAVDPSSVLPVVYWKNDPGKCMNDFRRSISEYLS